MKNVDIIIRQIIVLYKVVKMYKKILKKNEKKYDE